MIARPRRGVDYKLFRRMGGATGLGNVAYTAFAVSTLVTVGGDVHWLHFPPVPSRSLPPTLIAPENPVWDPERAAVAMTCPFFIF